MRNPPSNEYLALLTRLYELHNLTKSDEQRTVEKFGQPPQMTNREQIFNYLEINERNFVNPVPDNSIKINTTSNNSTNSKPIIHSKESAFQKI